MPLQRAVVRRPDQRGGLVHDEVRARLARARRRGCPNGGSSPARGSGSCFCQNPFVAAPLGEPVHVERRAGEVGQHDRRDPARRSAMQSRLVTGSPPGRAGNRDLVEIGEPQARGRTPPRCRPTRSASSAPSSPVTRPGRGPADASLPCRHVLAGGRSDRHSRSGSAFTSRWYGRSAPSGDGPRGPSPATASLVVLVQQQPLVPAGVLGPVRTSTKRPAELLAVACRGAARRRRRRLAGSSVAVQAPRCRGPRRSRHRRRTGRAGSPPRSRGTRSDGPRRGPRPAASPGSRVGPFGTAQLTSTPPISSRKS